MIEREIHQLKGIMLEFDWYVFDPAKEHEDVALINNNNTSNLGNVVVI